MAETRPISFKTAVATDPKLQAKVRAKVAKTRLPKDVKALLESKDYQAVLAVKDRMDKIRIKFKMSGGFYRNQTHILEIKLDASSGTFDYPFTAPLVKFLTPMYHVNISYNGSICLSILKGKDKENPEGWTEACSLSGVISAIMFLMDVPGIESPWNKEAAATWMASGEGKNEAKFMNEADYYYNAGNYKTAVEEFDIRYSEDNTLDKVAELDKVSQQLKSVDLAK
jgi:ubiquitin-protein ligase